MTFGGFDAAVAKKNGFRIEKDASGTERSVPITANAKALQASSSSQSGSVSPNNTVYGECGSSHLTATKYSNDLLKVLTGYTVPFNVQTKSWTVNATGLITGTSFYWTGGSNATWQAGKQATVIGSGIANVTLTSYAIAYDGRICHSGGPTDTFG